MTEEIIIDGVDVWSCKHYDLENNYCDQSYLGEGGLLKNTKNPKRCEGSPNCYYKQLKRLEFELKITKADYEASEQENKELKVVKEQLKKWNDENLKRQDDMQLWIDLAEEQRKNYRSALEEIKEIATNYFEECGVPDDYFKRNNYSWKQHQIKAFTCKLQQIIDKINEALGNEI